MYLNKKDIEKALSILAEEMEVFAPSDADGVRRYRLWKGGMPVLDGANMELPPKDILFPESESMYSFQIGGSLNFQELGKAPKRAIFGIRPCDMNSIDRMDTVFIKDGYVDSFYSNRRDNCLIIALSCPGAEANCFCESVGLDPNSAPSADVFLTDAGEAFSVVANNDKGKGVLESWKALLTEGKEVTGDTHCTLKFDLPADLPKKLVSMFHDNMWKKASQPCLGCGTCTYVCPTCYCFDVNNQKSGTEGVMFRCWDSCMFNDYSLIAGGINERPTKTDRLKNRYMHKFSYFNERYDGASLCVGCGRCITKCPAHLDITEFIKKAAEV